MFRQISTYKLNRFNVQLNNRMCFLNRLFTPENQFVIGVSKVLYEQLKPLDEEKPDPTLSKVYLTFKEAKEKRVYQNQTDLMISFCSNSLYELARFQTQISAKIGAFFDLITSLQVYASVVNSIDQQISFQNFNLEQKYIQVRVLSFNEEKIINKQAKYVQSEVQGFHFFQNQFNECGDVIFQQSNECAFATIKNAFYKDFTRTYELSNFYLLSEESLNKIEIIKKIEKEEGEEGEENKEGENGEEKAENEENGEENKENEQIDGQEEQKDEGDAQEGENDNEEEPQEGDEEKQ
ncbi:Hypothetical_protein [Hexamita inflata]|uniref:Hypothetical_protein n=1 Tax=Hexamita inflata TaxID=28002 RepID=A0AA86U857_9EUKA|nr:Hypothetical protein HINF_LOCUS30361 [Hexamita inflata]